MEDQAQALFEAALKLRDAAERTSFLDQACTGNLALRQTVDVLLDAQAEAATLASPGAPARIHADPKSAMTTVAAALPLAEGPGSVIGHYKLLQLLGEGGFGAVYMAEQQEPVIRKVALKIIKLGMDTREVVARFEAERQALALMDHPNIAKVFDGGSTASGRPYFVMELVKGIPFTQFCKERQLNTKQRLILFQDVCSAIQHAHQKGIIHRDLKPSNILVSLEGDQPVPKVIDFGVAKATQQRLTEKTLFTHIGQFVGTPAYMSPEQAGLGGLDIDTRSDIYSLGVLLYELLTGTTPFDTKSLLKSGFDEIQRTIREVEPPRPSMRLSTMAAEELSTVAKQRSAEPNRLGLLIRGDLDLIVMKALEKERTRRYETASALAADIGHYLKNEPVTAVAPSAAYRFRKFARRHQQGVVAVGVLLLLLLGGLIWQTVRMRQMARQARLVAQFFENSLKKVRFSVAMGRDPTMLRELLDEAASRVIRELTNQPYAQASVRLGIGFGCD